jgi:hypothetical protein
LTERLAESLRLSREARAAEHDLEQAERDEAEQPLADDNPAVADRLEEDAQADLDHEVDARAELLFAATDRDQERAKLAASAVLRLWAQASPHARELALTALVQSFTLSRDTAALTHGPAPADRGEHLCTELVMVCSHCLGSPGLPDKSQALVVKLSQAAPLSFEDQVSLGADGFIDRLLERARVHPLNPLRLDFSPDTGSLDVKLANLLRERTSPDPPRES